MSNYSQLTLFTPKDALVTGNPLKLLRGAEFDAELAAISAAIATKLDTTAAAALGANPSATIGLSAVNGVASTYIRSDGAPALSQAIAPTWSAQHTFSQPILHADGTAALPGLSFTNDPDTGMYRLGANRLGFATAGVVQLTVGTAGATDVISAAIPYWNTDGTAGAPSYSFANDSDTGIYRGGANSLYFSAGGTYRGGFDTAQFNTRVQNTAADGSAGAPTYSFENDPDTGIHRNANNEVGIDAGGVLQLRVGTSFISVNSTVLFVPDASAAAPSYSFNSDADTGFYRAGTNTIGMAEGGTGYLVGFRSIPRSTTATTLASTDIGRCVAITAAINIPASVFSAGDAISIYNDSAGALNLTISAGTLRLAGTTTTGTRSIAARGVCTIWFNVGGATPEVIASGNVS